MSGVRMERRSLPPRRDGSSASGDGGTLIAVIADDLTGANDSGLQFAACGLATTVCLGNPPPGSTDGARVVVFDTETRGLDEARVPPLVAAMARRIRAGDFAHVYKKIDSTMRGHVGLEIGIAAREMDARCVFLTPAYPAMKRTVENGRLMVDGVPVDQTPIARDPGSPVSSADLVALVSPGMPGLSCRVVPVSEPAERPERLADRLRADLAAGKRTCLIFDAASEADLAAVAAFGARVEAETGGPVLWAGSAGLAAHLPAAWGIPAATPPGPTLPAATRPPLLVTGSVNPVSNAQATAAAARMGLHPVVLCPDILLEDGPARRQEIARGAEGLRSRIAAGDRALLLTTAHERPDVDRVLSLAGRLGLDRGSTGQHIASGLAEAAAALVAEGRVDRLVATGGDTSCALMTKLRIAAMHIRGAIAPGVPLIGAGERDAWHIITKAGGFGSPETLADALNFLLNGRLDE